MSNNQTIMKSAKTIEVVKSVPKPVLVVGAVVGVVAIPVVSYILIAALGLAITAVKLGVIAAIVGAFLYMWPVVVRAMYMGRKNLDNALTRADPITALQLKRQEFAESINTRRALVSDAAGALGVYRRTFEENKKNLSPEKIAMFEANIQKRSDAVQAAREGVKLLEMEYTNFEMKIKEAEAEMRLAEADKKLAGSLARTGETGFLSETTTVALDEITRRVESAAMELDMVLEKAQ